MVPSSESVNHVKDAYDLNISRIHFADDYRIVYVRKYDVTAILGVVLKSGKEADYTRYDIIARRKDNLFKEMQELSDGSLSPEHQHYKIIKFLEEQQKKDMLKKQRKC